jgi:hypothetical protein
MKFTELRILGLLRRIAKALEERNRIEREKNLPLPPQPKMRPTTFSYPTIDDWNGR